MLNVLLKKYLDLETYYSYNESNVSKSEIFDIQQFSNTC